MITPADSPSAPAEYNAVPVTQQDIQAPQENLSGMVAAAMSEAMSRQAGAIELLSSPQGYGDFDITGGYTGSWGTVSEPDIAGP
jgi:hypothetical protein